MLPLLSTSMAFSLPPQSLSDQMTMTGPNWAENERATADERTTKKPRVEENRQKKGKGKDETSTSEAQLCFLFLVPMTFLRRQSVSQSVQDSRLPRVLGLERNAERWADVCVCGYTIHIGTWLAIRTAVSGRRRRRRRRTNSANSRPSPSFFPFLLSLRAAFFFLFSSRPRVAHF